ncbi:Prolyl 3-hydroxylase ogfod1 [Cichlidogyrus casuarinus]|uniref:Prolyl 3-hydroxylase ogfod1 n=1 Tax=Cichlidogyrus casuarinus TaxID=1844966 RepID=A0ABD2Q730_9PLAT
MEKRQKLVLEPLTVPRLRKWRKGDYSLLHDFSSKNEQFRLEAFYHCAGFGGSGDSSWEPGFGGQTVFYNSDDKETVLSISPLDNALSLAYVESNTSGFTRYIRHFASFFDQDGNKSEQMNAYYDLHTCYLEPFLDCDEDDDASECTDSDISSE